MLQEEIDRIDALMARSAGVDTVQGVIHASAPMTMSGNVATIPVKGALLSEPSFMMDFFGERYTVYRDISTQIRDAERRGASRIDLDIDSPGGTLDGLYATMSAIKNTKTPTRAVVTGKAASAAYMLASQTREIVARDELALVGSVGVATSKYTSKSIKDVANTDSPNKRPDVATEDGIAAVRGELDDIFNVLAERIAEGRGRNTTTEKVKTEYGRGAIMTARTALSKGMIDAIGADTKPSAEVAGNSKGEVAMDIQTLKSEHPALYAQVFNLGEQAGVQNERTRVEAHITLAEASGDMDTTLAAIRSGEVLTMAIQAKHMAAGINKRSIELRAQEAPAPVDAAGAEPPAVKPEEKAVQAAQAALKNLTLDLNVRREA